MAFNIWSPSVDGKWVVPVIGLRRPSIRLLFGLLVLFFMAFISIADDFSYYWFFGLLWLLTSEFCSSLFWRSESSANCGCYFPIQLSFGIAIEFLPFQVKNYNEWVALPNLVDLVSTLLTHIKVFHKCILFSFCVSLFVMQLYLTCLKNPFFFCLYLCVYQHHEFFGVEVQLCFQRFRLNQTFKSLEKDEEETEESASPSRCPTTSQLQ